VLVTEPFVAVADPSAALLGLPGYPYAVLPHPISRLPREELRRLAESIAPRVVELLTR
jgi:hypothetical protein